MWRIASGLLACLVVSCAHGRSCPAIDEERLARALAAEVLARAEANSDAPSDDSGGGADEPRYRIDVEGHPVRGPAEADVTIVEFADFQCPFCARVRPTLDAIREHYGDRVRFVYFHRPLPFHPVARVAAETANEAFAQGGSEAFFRFYELVYDEYRALDVQLIEGAAVEAGLDVNRLRQAIERHVHAAAVDRDDALAQRIGASGTPTFFINGRRLVGAQPLDVFTEVIDRELAITDRLHAAGVPRGRVYENLMRDAIDSYAEPPPPPDEVAADPPPPAYYLDPATRYRVPLGRSPSLGRADALVTLVMFVDLQDPFSARAMDVVDTLVDRYGPNLRVVFKHYPLSFHAYARYAAGTALEARVQQGDDGFFAIARRLFRANSRLDDEVIDGIARELRVDSVRLVRSRSEAHHDAEIAADEALAIRLGVTGTPTFFINGLPITGVRPIEQYAERIDAEIANARRMIANGVPREMVYLRIAEASVGSVDAAVDSSTRAGSVPTPELTIAEGDATTATSTVQVFTEFGTLEASRLEEHLAALRVRFGSRIRIVYRDRETPWNDAGRIAAEVGREVFAQKGIAGYLAYRRAIAGRGRALTATDPLRFAVSAGRAQRAAVSRALEAGTHRPAIEEDERMFRESGFDARSLPIVVIGDVVLFDLRTLEVYVSALSSQVEASP